MSREKFHRIIAIALRISVLILFISSFYLIWDFSSLKAKITLSMFVVIGILGTLEGATK